MPHEREPARRPRPKPLDVTLTVAARYLSEFDDVVARCAKAGLKVSQSLRTVGVISGTIAPSKLEDLQQVTGVEHVDIAATYQLPPPESPVQ